MNLRSYRTTIRSVSEVVVYSKRVKESHLRPCVHCYLSSNGVLLKLVAIVSAVTQSHSPSYMLTLKFFISLSLFPPSNVPRGLLNYIEQILKSW